MRSPEQVFAVLNAVKTKPVWPSAVVEIPGLNPTTRTINGQSVHAKRAGGIEPAEKTPGPSEMKERQHQLRQSVTRLRRYTERVSDKIDSGRREDLIGALADVAEVAEIARRLYSALQGFINPSREAIEAAAK
jgi:hypothetical protein